MTSFPLTQHRFEWSVSLPTPSFLAGIHRSVGGKVSPLLQAGTLLSVEAPPIFVHTEWTRSSHLLATRPLIGPLNQGRRFRDHRDGFSFPTVGTQSRRRRVRAHLSLIHKTAYDPLNSVLPDEDNDFFFRYPSVRILLPSSPPRWRAFF